MTNKITIQFNEIEDTQQKIIKELVEKPYNKLSQQDLLDALYIINRYRDCHYDPNEQKQMIERLLNMTLDSRLYRPMDQRSFIEYVTEIIYDWVYDNLNYDNKFFNPEDVFASYYADGTITYNTQETLNYIRSFWGEFHEDDLEYTDAKFVFDRSETFFVQQCHYMSIRILEAIFEQQDEYNKQEFLDYVDNEFDPVKLNEFIY